MRTLSKILSLAALSVFAAPPAWAAKIKVVTTTQDPAAITRAIGGDRVEAAALCKGFQDPHFLDAKPSYALLIHKANLVEAVGLELEVGYLPSLVPQSRNPDVQAGTKGFLDLSAGITPIEVVPMADRSEGDVHPNGNPHYWLDPENGRIMAREIAARLSALDPEGKATYEKNLADFEKQLDAKEADWAKRLEPLKGSNIVTYHKSWSYFAKRYGINVVGYIEPKPGIPPTPAHTLDLIKLMQEQKVKYILMENFYDAKVPNLIAAKTGAKVAEVPNSVAGEDAVKTYFDLFDRIVGELEKGLKS